MTEVNRLTIHRALTELKVLNSKIDRAISDVVIVAPNRKSNIEIGGMAIGEYSKVMQASFDKVIGLINYRNKLKAAVVHSNSITRVLIGGKRMSVAEAIERKASIQLEQNLLTKLKNQYSKAVSIVAVNNDALPEKLEAYLINILGSKDKHSPDEVKLHTDTFLKRNEWEVLDPISVKKAIEKLEEGIEEFTTDVDAVLSESNATTYIEVSI